MATATGIGWSGELRRFLRDFAAYAGNKGLIAAAFVAAGAVLEGLGLILIVPLMQFLLGGGRNVLTQIQVMSVRLDDIIRYPLPERLHFLYPLLRWPLWLWRRGSA